MTGTRIRWSLALAVALLSMTPACTSDDGRNLDGEAETGVTAIYRSAPGPADVWSTDSTALRLRDSLRSAPEVPRPAEPVATAPRRPCSPMPNAWIDSPLCRAP